MLLSSSIYTNAQDTLLTLYIDSVIVKNTRQEYESIGTTVYRVPARLLTTASVGDALALATPISFKQYGPGMLQSASARGTGASHLGVNWNGINIQGMTHGQVDFGLISIQESITYIPGGNSPMGGSGHLGGLVSLATRFGTQQGIKLALGGSMASFNNGLVHGQISFTTAHLSSQSHITYSKGKNAFPFINTASVNKPLTKQINNASQGIQFRQSFQYLAGKKNIFRLHYWLTNSFREIPPSMTAANDHAVQADQAHRIVADWYYSINKSVSLRTKLANINEQLLYKSDAFHSFTATSKQVIDSRLTLKKHLHQFNVGVINTLERATSAGFDATHQRFISAVTVADNWKIHPRFIFSGQARFELKDGQQFIPIFSSASEWKLNTRSRLPLLLKGKFGRHFHRPTFNDLFWRGLGVPDLKDETGYQGEISLTAKHTNTTRSNWELTATAFWLNVNNWILWSPNTSGLWRPSNKKKVQSTGLESRINYSYLRKPFRINFNINYTFVRSINKAGVADTGKQLLYVPRHKSNGHISFGYKKWACSTEQIFVSKRPIDSQNNKYLPFYLIQNVQVSYTPAITSTSTLNIFVRMNNLLNRNYQTIIFRPMPGRSFELGVRIHYSSK